MMTEVAKDPFEQQADRFLAFWAGSLGAISPVRDGASCGFLITPWLCTPVPWFSITVAMLYALRGKRPILIFNDIMLPYTEPETQVPIVERVLAEVGKVFEVLRLSEVPHSPCDEYAANVAETCARLYADVYLKKSQPTADLAEREERVLRRARRISGRVATLFAERTFDHFVIPGGLYGASSIYLALGRGAGVRIATYDSGPGALVVGTDDVAGHCLDVARAFEPQYDNLRRENARVIEFEAKREFLARLTGRDRYSYQRFALDEREVVSEIDVLMPLNIFDDAAGIARVQCFPTPRDWVRETVRWVLRRPGAKITVREHPSAARVLTNRSLCEELFEEFGSDSRFQIIRAEAPVSTYALLGAARVVLPCSSTVGIEAAALGKRVILESKVYYGGLGFAELKTSREEYFAAIDHHLDNYRALPADLQRKAWQCYFFGQLASFLDGSFTPQPVDFDIWVRRGLRELESDNQVSMFVDAFINHCPSCIVNAPRVLARADERILEDELDQMNYRLSHLSPTFVYENRIVFSS